MVSVLADRATFLQLQVVDRLPPGATMALERLGGLVCSAGAIVDDAAVAFVLELHSRVVLADSITVGAQVTAGPSWGTQCDRTPLTVGDYSFAVHAVISLKVSGSPIPVAAVGTSPVTAALPPTYSSA